MQREVTKNLMEAPKIRKYTYEEYLELEERSEAKIEFYRGYIIAMTGGTIEHNTIGGNMHTLLRQHIKGKPCRAYYEMKLQVENSSTYTFPDVMLTCDPRDTEKKRALVIEYPNLVIEVLSNSTRNLDKSDKLTEYRKLPSLLYYVTIEQYRPEVEIHSKAGDIWRKDVYTGMDDVINFGLLNLKMSLKDIYEYVEF